MVGKEVGSTAGLVPSVPTGRQRSGRTFRPPKLGTGPRDGVDGFTCACAWCLTCLRASSTSFGIFCRRERDGKGGRREGEGDRRGGEGEGDRSGGEGAGGDGR